MHIFVIQKKISLIKKMNLIIPNLEMISCQSKYPADQQHKYDLLIFVEVCLCLSGLI